MIDMKESEIFEINKRLNFLLRITEKIESGI